MALQGSSYKGLILPKPSPAKFPASTKVKPVAESKLAKIPSPGSTLRMGAIEARQFPHGPSAQIPKTLGFQPKPPKAKTPSLGGIGVALGGALVRGAERVVSHPKLVLEDIPKEFHGEGATQIGATVAGNAMHAATAAVLGRSGPVAAVGQELTKIPAEAINLPTQIPPTVFLASKAVVEAKKGNNKPLEQLEAGLKEGSLGKLVRGKPEAAAKQFGATPLQSTLEYSGAASLVDRLAGDAATALKLKNAPIKKAGEGPTSRPAKPLIGNATEPQRPYGKGYLQNLRQQAADANPTRPGEKLGETLRRKNLSTHMRQYVDRLEGRFHGAMRQVEAVAKKQRADAIRGPRTINGRVVPGPDAVNLYGHGILPDPATWHESGIPPGLAELAERYSKPGQHEVATDPERVAAYEAVERTRHDTLFHHNPFLAYKATLRMAEDKKPFEGLWEKLYGYTPEQMRAAKLTTPFQHWWADREPWVEHAPPLNAKGVQHEANVRLARELGEARKTSLEDVREARSRNANGELTDPQLKDLEAEHKTNIQAHKEAVAARKESAPKVAGEHHEPPFSISDGKGGRQHLTADEVAAELERKGIHESQLVFQSHRPYATVSGDLHPPVGTARGGVAPSRGFRSGKAFLEGHVELTHDAMARQYASEAMRAERERQNTIVNRELGLTTKHVADLLEEHLGKASPEARKAIQARIDRLRSGSTFFSPDVRRIDTPNGTTTEIRSTAWQRAQAEASRLKQLNPDLELVPYRIASPWTHGSHLEDIANSVGGAHVDDGLAPGNLIEPNTGSKFDEPHSMDRGEVGLMHKAAAGRLSLYEKRMGSNARTILGNWSSFWRKQNVAWSQKHIPGITQELGLRALAYKAGIGNGFRGYKALKEFAQAAQDPAVRKAMPEVDHYLAEIEHMAGASVIQQARDQTLHLRQERLKGTALGKLGEAFDAWKNHKVTGFPARMMADLGSGYMKVTEGLLSAEQKAISKPFRVAGFGKALNDEAKRLTGQRLPMFRETNDVMREFTRGQFNPKSVEMLGATLNEWYGDFQSASPAVRNAQVVSPFFTWYKQALKFVYHTLPVHHPIKTGVLAALEGATAAQREAEGQGYTKNLGLRPEGLEAAQQGSVPSLIKHGNRWELQYYMPIGAVSKGVEGAAEMVFPYLEEPVQILKGRSAFTGHELPGHPEGLERVLLAFGSLAEGAFPVARKVKLVAEGKAEKAFLPIRDNPARHPSGKVVESSERGGRERPARERPERERAGKERK